ncbi:MULTISPECIES: hypothetical protein [Sutcliffiella]|uniref:Uncharacterized protein n=1 Tax=Sutcliffiella cohnii TaxID=33932 RepID=A0A223KVC1_9BACI|nr:MULTISPECIES: hypothetical protein [Sutcliffiella]AST93314.1 hypothetical protein BC6307_19630 [Sutcliffiella cohnii]WBL14475.1 hypothetical protein O1A01_21780 [Sutcliffiella sp. NC1]
MEIAIVVALLIGVGSAIATLMLGGKSDENYRGAAKRNSINLSLIYTVVIILSFAALGIYLVWFV